MKRISPNSGKQASGPIQADPGQKVSMSHASFGRNRWENDFVDDEHCFETLSIT